MRVSWGQDAGVHAGTGRRHRAAAAVRTIALIGNPNSGKTTVFNALTGLRQKVGNYPGVTVEKKEGRLPLEDGTQANLIDLPGTYSLNAASPDERIAVDVLLGRTTHTPRPDLVVCVVDASTLERGLYLVTQIIDHGLPVVVALNMMDVAAQHGVEIDVRALEGELDVRVVAMVASKRTGVPELRRAIAATHTATVRQRQWRLPEPVRREHEELVGLLRQHHQMKDEDAFHEAIELLTLQKASLASSERYAPALIEHLHRDHEKLDFLGYDRQSVFIESRYEWVRSVCARAMHTGGHAGPTLSDRIDRVVTHRFWGIVIFLGLMGLLFEAIFSWATLPMEWIGQGFDLLGREVQRVIPPGDLQDLVVRGAIAGVAAVVTFLPQILFLFLFLSVLEDTGYMARAAFIMDRLMSRIGLHGKSFIPLLSSFACAIPGIMATRTIESQRDRLATMLVAPLISCSARLPVYALLIAAFIPPVTVLGFLSLPGVTLFLLYLLGLVAAAGMALLFKKTLLKGGTKVFLMELPPYKLPSLRSVVLRMWERASSFLRRAGTIILGVSILLWFLASYPKVEGADPSQQLQHSYAGMAGRLIEPVIAPLGFDWKIGIGLISSLLQREVFVSTMGTIYNIEQSDEAAGTVSLHQAMRSDTDPATGLPTFTILTAICLMVYYVLSMQCMSTVAVMRRETNGWKWPLFQIGYMTALAYVATFAVYRAGLWLGVGG